MFKILHTVPWTCHRHYLILEKVVLELRSEQHVNQIRNELWENHMVNGVKNTFTHSVIFFMIKNTSACLSFQLLYLPFLHIVFSLNDSEHGFEVNKYSTY